VLVAAIVFVVVDDDNGAADADNDDDHDYNYNHNHGHNVDTTTLLSVTHFCKLLVVTPVKMGKRGLTYKLQVSAEKRA